MLSAEANASFYTAFMVTSFLAMVPGNVALTLFAVASGDKAALRSKVRMGLLICMALGLPVVDRGGALRRSDHVDLRRQYADTAGAALAILALTYVPFVFHHFFLAISRVQGRVRGAGIFSVFAGSPSWAPPGTAAAGAASPTWSPGGRGHGGRDGTGRARRAPGRAPPVPRAGPRTIPPQA